MTVDTERQTGREGVLYRFVVYSRVVYRRTDGPWGNDTPNPLAQGGESPKCFLLIGNLYLGCDWAPTAGGFFKTPAARLKNVTNQPPPPQQLPSPVGPPPPQHHRTEHDTAPSDKI